MSTLIEADPRSVVANRWVYVRQGAPNRSAPIHAVLSPGSSWPSVGLAKGELVDGNDVWLAGDGHLFVWSGAVQPAVANPPAGQAAPDGGALPFVLTKTTTGQRIDWTFIDPVKDVRRLAGRETPYVMPNPANPKASLMTRGLSRYGGLASEAAPLYAAKDWEEGFGYWAWFIEPTAEGESFRNFTCVNSYDRAAFTFGCFQFAAHTVGRNLILLFRGLLAAADTEACRYFPDLALNNDGEVCVRRGDTLASLEGVADRADGLQRKGEQGRFMDYLNASLSSVDADETQAAARLISWACNSPAHRREQVRLGRDIAQGLLKETHLTLQKSGGSLDGVAMDVCAMIFDIRHQGRGHPAYPGRMHEAIKAALAKPDPMSMLMEFGAAQYGDRVERVHDRIHDLISATPRGALRYSASSFSF